MALKIEEVMELSLDDYIKISHKPSNSAVNNSNNYAQKTDGTNDAKFGRRKANIDEEEDEDDDMLYIHENKDEPLGESTPLNGSGVDTGIWKGPESSIAYIDCHSKQNDLREKLRNNNNSHNNHSNHHGQLTSVQYRLQAPNNAANRPRGIPTLLPLDAYVRQNNSQQNGRRRMDGRRDYRGRNRNGGNRGYNNGGNNNNNYGGGNVSFGGCGGGVVSGRIQRNRQQDIPSKNLRLTVNRNDNNNLNDTMASQETARNMVISTPSQCINLEQSGQLNSQFQIPQTIHATNGNGNQTIPVGNLTPQAQAALNLNSNQFTTTTNNNDSLKSLLGFQGNVSGDMMPVFASRLLDFIQNGSQAPVHKPMYDMKIQKDIHEIQNKPLLYKCNGGEVVSSDGAGVNCKIIPRTSGVSLNCRFA